jgi:hypothetical protein
MSYNKKNIILWCGIGLLLILSYKLALSKTINAIEESKELKLKIALADSLQYKINELNNSIKQVEFIALDKKTGGSEINQNLLSEISKYCQQNDINLREFPESNIIANENYDVMTSHFKVEGRYIGLVKLVNLLEKDKSIGKIISVRFRSFIEIRTKKKILEGTIYVQNILKHE